MYQKENKKRDYIYSPKNRQFDNINQVNITYKYI